VYVARLSSDGQNPTRKDWQTSVGSAESRMLETLIVVQREVGVVSSALATRPPS
jgi:hypothetical protein